jgi:hypothetical protein
MCFFFFVVSGRQQTGTAADNLEVVPGSSLAGHCAPAIRSTGGSQSGVDKVEAKIEVGAIRVGQVVSVV